jgi:predicted permease
MTIAEVALAIMLVAGAGWLVRGFASLRNVDAGFRSEQRLLFDVSFQGQRFPNGDAVRQATSDLMTSVRGLQGVTGVGSVSNYPLKSTPENSLILQFEGKPLDTAKPKGARQRFVSAGLFSAMGTGVVQGRDFGPEDAPGTQATAIVNRMFVRRYLDGADPIGVRFAAGYPAPNPAQMVQVVGVIDDVRQRDLGTEAEPAFYSPISQVPLRRLTMVVSTSLSDLAPLQSAIRDVVRRADPLMAINFEEADEVVATALRRQQLGMTLMLIFGAVAVLLAAVGIYGVVAYAVSQRRDEMATRLALGATPGSVFRLVMRQGLTLAIVGTVIGVGMAYLSGKIVSNQVYAVRASDPLMLSIAILLVVGIAIGATMLPAWRASKLSPARALHPE